MDIEEYKSLITNYPLFNLLSQENIEKLALLGKEVFLDKDSILFNEGSPVDCFYLIISGTAQVTRTVATVEKIEIMPIAVLEKGNAIGLSEIGFFSHTGTRTATITSLTPLRLLKFELNQFVEFLKTSTSNYPALRNVGETILLTNFIQKIDLFKNFPNEKIQQLSKKVKKIIIKKGTKIFQQGDIADNCYFILTGKIVIFSENKEAKYLLKTIEPQNIFGEGAFYKNELRNASAYAETDCELFILEKKWAETFTESQNNEIFSDAVSLLRIQQVRPRHSPDVSIQKITNQHGETIFSLNKTHENKKLQLSPQDYIIWSNINGKATLKDIKDKNFSLLKELSIYDLYQHVLNMASAGFLILPSGGTATYIKTTSLWKNFIKRITSLWKNK